MSQVTKKQILEILVDLKEGTQTLRDLKDEELSPIWKGNLSMFGQLICMLGDHLLSLGEVYRPVVDLIEEYCVYLRQIETESLTQKERSKVTREQLKIVEKLQFECKKQLPEDRKELVFFPYLYAMWDSLESIWQAAVDSGEYDVYVVPIPYYERKSDGSLGEMKYDGMLYPDQVQAVKWETYHVEKRKPAVAYIHNPYDDMNKVTSIHPNFYSDILKEHVGSLVYVPYFVGVNDIVGTHFCVTPVTIKADKIIVQSENVQDIYVEELYRFAKENQLKWSRESLRKRILPLGSPKYDIKNEAVWDIPEAWKSVLYRADGSKKKVVLLNSTLHAVLNFGDEAFDKLIDTLDTFQTLQEEIALLWRPHPLMESTLKSMRPQWYDRYLEIVEKYQKGQWGIFDNSEDFQRAVGISDAYYGDRSSVVDVFEKAGKPLMIQNYKILYQSEYVEKEEGK